VVAEDKTGGDRTGIADPPKPVEIDYDAILREKTGGKVEKWDDLLAKLEAKQETPVLNDVSKKLYQAIVEGKEEEIAEVLYTRRLLSNVDKLGDADVVKFRMQWENPDWTPEDVEDEFNEVYNIGIDKDDDPEGYAKVERRIARKLAAEAKTARQTLLSQKDTIQLPEFGQQSDPEMDAFMNEYEGFSKQYAELGNTLKSFDKLDLSITDEDVQFRHEYSVDDNEKADLANKAKDYWHYLKSRYAKDGKFDTQKFAEDIYFNENRSKILKSAVTRAMNLAKAELVKGVANVQDNRTPSPSTNTAAEQARADFEKFLLG
jgi:hypothetical protein